MTHEIKEFTVGDCLDFINNLLEKKYITKEDKMGVVIGQKIHPLVMNNPNENKNFEIDKSIVGVLSIGTT